MCGPPHARFWYHSRPAVGGGGCRDVATKFRPMRFSIMLTVDERNVTYCPAQTRPSFRIFRYIYM